MQPSVSGEERARARGEWEARWAAARVVVEFGDLRSENDSVPGAYGLTFAVHKPSGRWLVELWMAQGYVAAGELRGFAEAVLRGMPSEGDVVAELLSVPCSGDPVFVRIDVVREAGQLCLLAQFLDGSCGSLEMERVYSEPAELMDGARALLAALDE